MPRQIILLSGPIASGKSSLSKTLVERFSFHVFKTRELIQAEMPEEATERKALQAAGEKLDRKTKGTWVGNALAKLTRDLPADASVIVDAVRIEKQVEAVRNAFGRIVVHVHLDAPDDVLAERYKTRQGPVTELASYSEAQENRTEKRVRRLARSADIVVDTARCSQQDLVVRVAARLGLFGRSPERLVDVLIGGQYGSEGKGHIASHLADEYGVLVRVGGPNAGHKVYENPSPVTFHHLPSGTDRTAHRKTRILLGAGSVLAVPKLLKEISRCELTPERLVIDRNAMVICDKDRQLETNTLAKAIGSTAQGVGAATARKLLRGAMEPAVELAHQHRELKPYIGDVCAVLDDSFANGDRVLLEGTQGTGLSLHHGAFPHVTSRDTTVSGCLAEAGIAPSRVRKIIMVCRTYPIRVESPKQGTSGPMTSELSWEEISHRSGVPLEELEAVERTSTTNRKRRVGEFDWHLLRRAVSLNGPTDIALTFTDYITIKNRKARRFDQLSSETIQFIEEIERVAAAPVSLIATRFHFRSIRDRRSW